MLKTSLMAIGLTAILSTHALAGEASVLSASAKQTGQTWRFDVTVRHADAGWDHYADAWRVVGPDGAVYGVRTLYHPHVEEQPFTRSLTGIAVPAGVGKVTIQAKDSVHGWGAKSVVVALP